MTHRLLFVAPFDDLVASGEKRCTIRRVREGLPQVGDRLELCQPNPTLKWQMIRDDVTCTSVRPIRIYRDVDGSIAVEINGVWQDQDRVAALAKADGFRSVGHFLGYFRDKGLPFKGVFIKWEVRPDNPYTPPPVRECRTCKHEGNSLEDWPCRTSMNAAGLMCWEPKEVPHGAARP